MNNNAQPGGLLMIPGDCHAVTERRLAEPKWYRSRVKSAGAVEILARIVYGAGVAVARICARGAVFVYQERMFLNRSLGSNSGPMLTPLIPLSTAKE